MMKFVTTCKDNKTGHIMALSEVSYNVAMDWLHCQCEKYFREIFRTEMDDSGLIVIYTGIPKIGTDFNGDSEKWYTNIVKFYYDEGRGYLMED